MFCIHGNNNESVSRQSVHTKNVSSASIETCHLFSELAASWSGNTVFCVRAESVLVCLEYNIVVSAGVCCLLYQHVPTLGIHHSPIVLYID